MRCLIVDDEPLAQQVIEEFAGRVPFLRVIAKCNNASEAAEVLHNTQIDLIFLDIHMPRISGLDFIASVVNPPQFIFVTAYSEHALQGFNVNATDYLMKPVPFNRFLKSVNKAHELFSLRKNALNPEEPKEQKYILVKSGYQTVKIVLDTILYIEGLKDYVKIHTEGKKPILSLLTMKGLAETLPEQNFIRIHKSFIIALDRVTSISRSRVMILDRWIPVGGNYREGIKKSVFKK